jgi:hypothetical protein
MRAAVLLLFLVFDPVYASVASASTVQANFNQVPNVSTGSQPGTDVANAAPESSGAHAAVTPQALSQLRPIIYMTRSNNHRRGFHQLKGHHHLMQMRQDEPLTQEACEAGSYFVPNPASCVGCPLDSISDDGASECTKCPANEQPDGDQAECVKTNEVAGVPTWLLDAYLGLLMTLSLLGSLASMSEFGDQVHRRSDRWEDRLSYYMVHFILPFITLSIVVCGSASITGYGAKPIVATMFVVFLITKGIVLATVWARYIRSTKEDEELPGWLTMIQNHANPVAGNEKALLDQKAQKQVEVPTKGGDKGIEKKGPSKKEPSKVVVESKKGSESEKTSEEKKPPETKPKDDKKKKPLLSEGVKKLLMSVAFHMLTIGLALVVFIRIMTDSVESNLRRGDFTILFLLQAIIQLNMAVMLTNLVAKEGHVHRFTLMAMVGLMMLHAILLPLGVSFQLYLHPHDAITDEQFATVASVANFYALIVAGVGVALSIMQEAGTGAEEALKKADVYKEQVVRITKWLANNPCPSASQAKKLEKSGTFFQLRIQEVFNKLSDDVVCTFGATLKAPFAWGETDSDLCPKLNPLKSSDPAVKCAVRRAVLEELQQFLVIEAKKAGNVLKMSGSFVLLLMLGAGYFQAINDIVEGFSELKTDKTWMPNVYASSSLALIACIAFVGSFFMGGGVEMVQSECRPMDGEKCPDGHYRDNKKCDSDTPCVECVVDAARVCPDDTFYIGKDRCEKLGGAGIMPPAKPDKSGANLVCNLCPEVNKDGDKEAFKKASEEVCGGVESGGVPLDQYVGNTQCSLGNNGKSLLDVCEPSENSVLECYDDHSEWAIKVCGFNKYYVGQAACMALEKEIKTYDDVCQTCPDPCESNRCRFSNAAHGKKAVCVISKCFENADAGARFCGKDRYYIGATACSKLSPDSLTEDTMCQPCSDPAKRKKQGKATKACEHGCELNNGGHGSKCRKAPFKYSV